MSEDNITSNALDQGVDQNIRIKQVSSEKLVKNSSGRKVALENSPLSDTDATENRSWTMAEIERTVAQSVLPGSKTKLAQYGINLARKNDFRLKDLSRRIESQLGHDHAKEIANGSAPQRVRSFDIQSQTMRLITANASLGTYQFQKTQALPYMRKSLALSYEKANLLKRVVGGIGSLEKAVVSKLEAIKLNTAAATPENSSILQQIKAAVYAKKIDRVATNVSNFVLDGYEEQYRKHIFPLVSKTSRTVSDPNGGGVNGVANNVTNKLSAIRRSARMLAGKDSSTLNTIDRFRQKGARVLDGALGGTIRLSQKVRLSTGINQAVTRVAEPWMVRASKFTPFGSPGTKETHPVANSVTPVIDPVSQSPMTELTRVVKDWRTETRGQQKELLEHITAIRQHVSPFKRISRRRTPLELGSTQSNSGPLTKTLDSVNPLGSKPADRQTNLFKSLFGGLGKRIDSVTRAIQSSDKARTKFERNQIKQQTLLEKAAAKARIRKGSYEDLLLQRKEKLSASALGTSGKMTGGIGSAAAAVSSLFGNKDEDDDPTLMDMLKDQASDKLEEAAESTFDKAKSKLSRGYRRARVSLKRGRAGRLARGASRSTVTRGAGKTFGRRIIGGTFRGLRGLTKFGGKGALTLGKSGLGLGLAAGVAQHYFDKSGASGGVKRLGDTGFEMAQYGGLGATIGGFFGGIGAVPGAVIGASFGALVANADRASSQLSSMGHKFSQAGSSFWTGLFGQNAIVKEDGTVVQTEKSSILDDLKIAFVGRKARYSSSGDVITTERSNLVGSVKYGFEKLLWGDKFNNGEYKEGTSIIDMVGNSVKSSLKSFTKGIKELPGQIKEGFTNAVLATSRGMENAYDSAQRGTQAAGSWLSKKWDQTKSGYRDADKALQAFGDSGNKGISNWYKGLGTPKGADDLKKMAMGALTMSSLTGFTIGASSAIYGWGVESNKFDSPSSPYYGFITEALSAYGVKDRSLYRFIHSLETSQEKINKGETKPFDDNDMVYMAGRFGLDSKNKDAVNYFKMWFKRRFLPAMELISKVLKPYNLTFDSFLSANTNEINSVTENLKKTLGASDIRSIGLEPSALAYAKYSKIASADPGGVLSSTTKPAKPFDPRAPGNRGQTAAEKARLDGGSQYNKTNYIGRNSEEVQRAARKKAAMTKGGVKDQPEYRSAYQKLPPNLRKLLDSHKALQFVLWSTSVQHGPDIASQIFQRDYSDGVDERSYVRRIYEDRSTRFGDLGSEDRTEAVGHLGQEQRFVEDLWGGRVKDNDMSAMGNQISGVVDPNGVGSVPVSGDVKSRAKDALAYLIAKGYTKAAASGIVANLIVESKLKTNAVGDSGRAHGIAQWHPDRRGPISRRFGKAVEAMNLHEQLDAVDWEMRSGNGVTGRRNLANSLNSTDSAAKAAQMVMNLYERPAERTRNGMERGGIANTLMKTVGTDGADVGKPKPTPAGGSTNPAPTAKPTQQPASVRPPAKPANTSTQPTRTSQPAKPDTHDSQMWIKAMGDHAKSLDNHAKAVQGSGWPSKGGDTNNVVMAPFLNQNKANHAKDFLTMHMKKVPLATGAD